MKTDHPSTRTITDDQALELAMRISEARALIYLLATLALKDPHGINDDPDREEQDGICGLVKLVRQGLSEAFNNAMNASPSENSLGGDSRGGYPPHGTTTPGSRYGKNATGLQ